MFMLSAPITFQAVCIYCVHLDYSPFCFKGRLQALKATRCPILLVVGTKDLLVRPSNSFAMQRDIGCPMHVYEDMGHGVIGQVPLFFNQRLLHHWAASTLSLPLSTVMETFHKQAAMAEQEARTAASASAEAAIINDDDAATSVVRTQEVVQLRKPQQMRRSASQAVTRADFQLRGEEVESQRTVSFRPLPYYSEWPSEKMVIRIPLDVCFPLSPESARIHRLFMLQRSRRTLFWKLLTLLLIVAFIFQKMRRFVFKR